MHCLGVQVPFYRRGRNPSSKGSGVRLRDPRKLRLSQVYRVRNRGRRFPGEIPPRGLQIEGQMGFQRSRTVQPATDQQPGGNNRPGQRERDLPGEPLPGYNRDQWYLPQRLLSFAGEQHLLAKQCVLCRGGRSGRVIPAGCGVALSPGFAVPVEPGDQHATRQLRIDRGTADSRHRDWLFSRTRTAGGIALTFRLSGQTEQ